MTWDTFWSQVAKTSDGCLIWVGYLTPKNYARARHNGRQVMVHDWVWEQANGPIPAGKELDHLCRRRPCVNIAHLELVTHRENLLRSPLLQAMYARNRGKTHCLNGHPFDEANTYIIHKANGLTERQCKACVYERHKKARAKERA